jgi:hypothetical protein
MQSIYEDIIVNSKKDVFDIYPIGDTHLGARNCAENKLAKAVEKIRQNPNARWIGGGDLIDAIKPSDIKRYDSDTLPDWLLEGDPADVRKRLNDVVDAQIVRLLKILNPIKGKCLGCIEGNHEQAIRKYHNQDVHANICAMLETENISDEAFFTLRFIRCGNDTREVTIYAQHGHGGGRTAGAEPNHLARMTAGFRADLLFRGHSHTTCIMPTNIEMGPPQRGGGECVEYQKRTANWGCWKYSHMIGPSTYESRAAYPARAMETVKAVIKPFEPVGNDKYRVLIEMRSVSM